ncbi:MAG: hypothetical protein NZM04_07265 [Methylacidiphilales bacterium]|nr:hypothetical protein [Candidatus Methylacidiphilales bacterium]MDW8349236.1 hypothetical protein [Verrucomicrobiae bacterium]
MRLLTPEQRRYATILRKTTYILLLTTTLALGYYLFIGLSEMRLTGHIYLRKLQLPTHVTILHPIQSKFDSLILQYRQILIPLVREQFKLETEISHYRKIIRETVQKIEETENQLAELQIQLLNLDSDNALLTSALQEINNEELQLDQQYRKRLEEFANVIRRRAEIQKLKVTLDTRSPLTAEKIITAFRLSLYSPPPNLNVEEERDWLRRAIQIWQNYDTQWNDQKRTLQEKRNKLLSRHTPETIKKQQTETISTLEQLQNTLHQTENALRPIRQKLISTNSQIQSYYEQFNNDIRNLPPKNKIIDLPISPDGTFTWSNLTDSNLLLPGSYALWIQASHNNTTYWTLQHFYLQAHANTQLHIHETAFQPLHDIIPILHLP